MVDEPTERAGLRATAVIRQDEPTELTVDVFDRPPEGTLVASANSESVITRPS
ncbi:hypothetical protein AB0I69_17025 [Streptomyces sp. NPDC050508]|uniref:hypothetical protein n=1 Tax=Streptomyces sp. NPDC050508 TaxID=3155405 RepID=UPI003436D160